MPIFKAKCCAWRRPSALEEGQITYNNVNDNAFTKQLFSIMFHKRNIEIDTPGSRMIFWIRMSEADIPISSANTNEVPSELPFKHQFYNKWIWNQTQVRAKALFRVKKRKLNQFAPNAQYKTSGDLSGGALKILIF